MDSSYDDLLKEYEEVCGSLESPDDGPSPMERLLGLEEEATRLMQDTIRWYLNHEEVERNGFKFRRLAQEIREFRDKLLDYQLILNGIDLTDHPDDYEVDLG